MPIPKYNLPEYKPDENELKADIIIRKLSKMGYKLVAKTHRLACGMKATYFLLVFCIE